MVDAFRAALLIGGWPSMLLGVTRHLGFVKNVGSAGR